MPGPLHGIRVIDLSSVVLGPYCTQILGDLGADIIKVESPEGDTTRMTGPQRSPDMAALFMGVNRNKRSIVLDLKQDSAKKVLWQLIETADVFVYSIRPQKLEKLGFGERAVRSANPAIICAGLHGYQSEGPYTGQPAYDDVIQGQSGSADLMARLIGEPRYMPSIVADKTVALVATYSIIAALFARQQTGVGQFVEIPMFETMVSFNLVEHLFGGYFSPAEGEIGYSRVLAPWRRPYKTKDSYICMLAYTDPQWQRFWHEVGAEGYAMDPRFVSLKSRSEHIGELYRLAGTFMTSRTTDEWITVLNRLEIPTARIARLEELVDDPHLKAIDFFKTVSHPTEGDLVLTGMPVKFSETPAEVDRLQPKLGEHSVEVLETLGLDGSDIDQLIETGACVDGAPLMNSNLSNREA